MGKEKVEMGWEGRADGKKRKRYERNEPDGQG